MTLGFAAGLLAIAAAVSFGAAELMRRLSQRLGFTDAPNERSSHQTPTPRAGGVGFALAVPILTAIGLHILDGGITTPERALLAASAALGLVGLADDRYGLPVSLRLGAHLIAAVVVVTAGGVMRDVEFPGFGVVSLGALAVPITIVWLVSLTNIYNFMDGIDGLAASQAVIAACAIAMVAGRAGRIDVAIGMTTLAAGAAGFLALNWPPARIFMGDVGSTFLGFSFGAWAVVAMTGASGRLTPLAWIIALFPFVFDGTYTLLRRILRREPFYRAHRSHLYQRLVQAGWTHRKTTLLYATLAAWSSMWMVLHYRYGIGSPPLAWAAAGAPVTLLPIFVYMSSEVSA